MKKGAIYLKFWFLYKVKLSYYLEEEEKKWINVRPEIFTSEFKLV